MNPWKPPGRITFQWVLDLETISYGPYEYQYHMIPYHMVHKIWEIS